MFSLSGATLDSVRIELVFFSVFVVLSVCGAMLLSIANFHAVKPVPWPVVPGGLPFFGQLFNLGGPKNLFHKLEEWATLYGTQCGVYEFCLLGKRFLVACREDTVFEVLKQRPHIINKSKVFSEAFNSFAPGLFSAEGDTWRADRRVVTPAFNHQNITSYLPKLKHVVKRLINKWIKDSTKSGESTVLSVNEDMTRMTCDLTSLVAFNVDFNTLSRRDCQMATDLSDVVSRYGFMRLWAPFPYWKIPLIGQYLDGGGWTIRRLHKEVGKLVKDYEDNLFDHDKDGRAGTFLAKLISLNNSIKTKNTSEGGVDHVPRLSHERLVGNILSVFLGGTDTSAITLSFCLWHIASDDSGLQDELATEASALPSLDMISIEDLYDGAPRMRSLIYEVLRLKGPVPSFYLENLEEEANLAGTKVPPRGAIIVPLMRYINTHPSALVDATALRKDLQTDDPRNKPPDAFDGRRWVSYDTGSKGKEEFVLPPKTVMPFGFGHRMCPGKNLAITQVLLCLVEIMRAFHISPEDGHPCVGQVRLGVNSPDREIKLILNRRAKLE